MYVVTLTYLNSQEKVVQYISYHYYFLYLETISIHVHFNYNKIIGGAGSTMSGPVGRGVGIFGLSGPQGGGELLGGTSIIYQRFLNYF